MLRTLLKLLSGYYLVRALFRGPRAFTGYVVRRQLRRTANKAIRRVR